MNAGKGFPFSMRKLAAKAGYYSAPSFMIIGAQKGGTTALRRYLSEHPQLILPADREMHFFDDEENFSKGFAFYHAHFPLPVELKKNQQVFECTPKYLYCAQVAERLYRYNPKLKLIAVLRNPVERAYSSWNMIRQFAENPNSPFHHLVEKRAFKEVVEEELGLIDKSDAPIHSDFVRRGIYHEQLKRYFALFPSSSLLILDSVKAREDTSAVLRQVTDFLEIEPFEPRKGEYKKHHVRQYTEPMDEETRSRLESFYRPHNLKLYELLGYDFGWDRNVAVSGGNE